MVPPSDQTRTSTRRTTIRSYLELVSIPDYYERYNYLKIGGGPFETTFGSHRYLNQLLYQSKEWKKVRRDVIIRDLGCDLGCPDHPIYGKILVHHIEPITIDDIRHNNPCVFDMNNLICVSHKTHNAIHFGDESQLIHDYVPRKKDDTCPWKQ